MTSEPGSNGAKAVIIPIQTSTTNLLGLRESTVFIEISVINMKVNDNMFLLKLKQRSFGVMGSPVTQRS